MSKTSNKELAESIATQMANYFKEGEINSENIIKNNLDFKGIESFQDLEIILKIHFVLSEEVVSFLEKLPERVRRIKTESEHNEKIRRGQVRGRIDWKKTLNQQNRNKDSSIFVCKNPSKNYDVPENLVLKKLLSIIYHVLDKELKKPIEKDYKWLCNLKGQENLINHLKNIYQKNVHINRIMKPEKYQITNRNISICESSRKELYQETAKLMNRYNKLMEGKYTKDEYRDLIEELLNQTLILPGETHKLFELYALFGILKKRKIELGQKFELKKIELGSEEIAFFKEKNGNREIKVYHDSTGSKRINLFINLKDIEGKNPQNEVLKKYKEAVTTYSKLNEELLENKNSSFYSGRPDILIEEYKNKKLEKVVIGEVKYTDNKSTFRKGLKELVEYLYFSRENNKYLLDEKKMEGILIVDKKDYLGNDKINKDKGYPFKLKIYDTEDLK